MYNGWKNRETWNVVLWISNDEGLWGFAKDCRTYQVFVDSLKEMSGDSSIGYQTPDGVAWNDSGLDYPRLDEFFLEIREEDKEEPSWVDEFVEEECEEGHDYY
jgi:hypothetical protein